LFNDDVERHESLLDKSFNSLWEKYPRKINKAGARSVVIARLKSSKGALLPELSEAVANYAALRAGQDQSFTMHPKTFFGPQERWKDFLNEGPGLVSQFPSRADRAEEIATCEEYLLDLFRMTSELEIVEVTNPLALRLMAARTLSQMRRMTVHELNSFITATAYEKGNQ